jgi:aspartate racemase
MKTIGLIGGISWQSSITYYQVINRKTNDLLGGSHSATVLMYSVDFDEVSRMQHEGRWDDFQGLLIDAAKKLERGGADFFLICANTPHIVADAVAAAVGIPLVHIGDAVGQTIKDAGFTKVGLLGTRFTMEKDFLKDRLRDKFGIESIVPEQQDRDIVHSVIYNELVNGDIRDESRNEYLRIIDKLTADGAGAIILGCTEIPLLVTSADTDAVLFDTARIHAERAVDLALGRADAASV